MKITPAIRRRWRSPSAVEESYLREAVSAYLRRPIEAGDIVWRYAGVRPLRDDGASKAQEATRDYVLELEGNPPLLSVFGGKITTHRRLAEAAMARLAPFFPGLRGDWTVTASLPGGRFSLGRRGGAAPGDAAPISIPARTHGAPAGPQLRHAGARRARRCGAYGGSRRLLRCRPDRTGDHVAARHRMGPHGRGHAMAAQQAGAALSRDEVAALERWLGDRVAPA